jgi:hypothetical protein
MSKLLNIAAALVFVAPLAIALVFQAALIVA